MKLNFDDNVMNLVLTLIMVQRLFDLFGFGTWWKSTVHVMILLFLLIVLNIFRAAYQKNLSRFLS